ncbi:jg5043 [Pararge aegeria aegeria]|uniref:Jg5043 protein n=1 Tax=Pararge aegeria aegeria TaxID=348720 RepID=A0A8S4SG84_9NEOP|nr:jg5043 [Pararge aegeria aegeria]
MSAFLGMVERLSDALTFDPEVQLVGDGLPLGVERGAGVAAAAVARHLLQHQALVAVEHARRGVVRQLPVLTIKRAC